MVPSPFSLKHPFPLAMYPASHGTLRPTVLLQPRDHTHELLHKAVSGLGIKDSQHDKHSLQLNEVGTHSRRLRSDSSVSSSASYCSNFSSVSAEASMSTCAGTSTEAEVGLEAGGRHRIASTGSMQRASRAPKHAKDRRDAPNVIYPRRKVGQDMRNSNQVVVTAEILEQVKFSKSHLPILYSMAGALWGTDFSAFLQHFHMPLHDAATKLGLCATAIKKACRRFGILRWPFRDRHRILSSCGSGASVTLPTTKRRESQREREFRKAIALVYLLHKATKALTFENTSQLQRPPRPRRVHPPTPGVHDERIRLHIHQRRYAMQPLEVPRRCHHYSRSPLGSSHKHSCPRVQGRRRSGEA